MRQRFRAWLNRADPLEETWSGIGRVWRHSAWILIVLVGLILAVQSATGIYGWLGTAAILGLLLAACLGVWLALILLSWLPSGVRGGLLLLVVPLVPVALFAPLMLAALYVMLALTLALTTAGFLRYRRGLKTSGSVMLTVGGLSLLLSLFAFAITGWDTEAPSGWSPIKSERLRLQSPVEPGAYNVVEMSYGSGNDRHRVEYASEADWVSNTVDGSKLLEGWDGPAGWARTGYWGFDPSALPVQGRVWLPEGDGPFPLVLIGHSRGGEAVSEAALFNRLPRYPDDGTLTFDFDFGIRGIIAIAPVDHQYHPRDRDTELEDTNFLVIHGSHDSDVDAFAGTAMYSRLRFESCEDCFKSSFYLVGANHGQFNTGWGRYDTGLPAAKMLNVQPLMDPAAQRNVARVLFTAFLETVLHERREYRHFLARPESGAHWFPEGVTYLSNYADARQIELADFEEDADLLSAGESVESVVGRGLSLWKEAEVPLKWRDADSAAVLLGWGGEDAGEPPVFEINLLAGGLAVAPDMTLSFSAAMATDAPEGVEEFEVPESLDFEVELLDTDDRSARVALSTRRLLYPQVDPVLYKLEALSGRASSEATFQRYVFRFSEWQEVNPELNITALKALRFVFPAQVPASVWLDDIAISPDGY